MRQCLASTPSGGRFGFRRFTTQGGWRDALEFQYGLRQELGRFHLERPTTIRERGSSIMSKNERAARTSTGVSRRQFLIGAGLASLGAAGAGLAGCAPSTQAADETATASGAIDSASLAGNPLGANAAVEWSFMTPPADIPADQITGTEDVDVLVVGADSPAPSPRSPQRRRARKRCASTSATRTPDAADTSRPTDRSS